MIKIKDRPLGIWLFAVVIIIFNLYYWYPVYTGTWPFFHLIFTFSRLAFLFWSSIILTIIELYAVTYGFYNAKNWARLYEIGYLSYSSFWAILFMFVVRKQVIEHYIYFVLYVILIMYLLMSFTKEYFGKKEKPVSLRGGEDVYRYGEYTLYSSNVKLRSGRIQKIYFFSKKKTPKAGRPSSKPDNYIVNVNPKTGMPYLKKEQ